MKKLISTIASCLLLLSGAASADKLHSRSIGKEHNLRFGVDTELGIPLGNYADANSVGGGAFATGEYALTDLLGATMRVGFQAHVDRNVGTASSHFHAVPVLLGAKYFIGTERQGLFGAAEAGMFALFGSVTRGATPAVSTSDVKFGMGLGLGYQQSQWNVRVNIHSQDVGNFGSALMFTGGLGYQFIGL